MFAAATRTAAMVEETLLGAGFDIKFLGDYINKPGDGDFHLVGVRAESDRVILTCRGDVTITIETPDAISARDRSLCIFSAAKVELAAEEVLGSVAIDGDDVVVLLSTTPERRLARSAIVTPLVELVYVFRSPPTPVDRAPGLRGAKFLDDPNPA